MIYYKKFIDFLQKYNLLDKESFVFISNHTTNIDYNNLEERNTIGCYYNINEEGILKDFKVYVPEIIDERTTIINIHEYIHALILYKHLNKKCEIGLEKEVLPLMYEKIYVIENEELSLREHEKALRETINEMNNDEYIIGSKVAEQLILNKKESIETLNEKAKKLVREYKK